MKDNKYCHIVSETVLAEDKKTEIKNALHKAAKAPGKCGKIAVSKPSYVRKIALKWTAAVASVAIVVVCAGYFLLPIATRKQRQTVKSPISAEDATHIAEVTENAQYLPNTELLASSGYSASALSSVLDDGGYDPAYENVYKADEEVMSFSKDEYDEFNNNLATISGTGAVTAMTIDDLKFEISMALDNIPGYDQWFQMPYEIPQMSATQSNDYTLYSYNLSYDKESEKITMRRLGWRTRGETYDVQTGIFYDDAYQRQYIEVEYYHDELGREVVDCTVFDFLCVKEGEYYPIYAQKLINIKDCSTTKYAVTYMRNFELVNEIQNNDDAFDKSDMYDYGINTLIIQLDYSSGDDMTLMKAQYSTADKHQKLSTSGTAAYYKKSANSTVYYSNKWDNIVSYINGYPVNSVQSGYCVNYYPDDLDKPEYRDYFHRRLGKALISMSELRYAYTCDLCENSKITSDGVFIDCSHYILSPTVNRYFNEIISDDEKYFSDSSLVWLGMTSQLEKFVDNLGVEYDISLNMNGADFGNSINGFAVEFGKKYYKEKVNAGELGKIERYINENTTRIDEYEYPTEMIGKLTFTYGTVEDSKMDDKVLEISFSTHTSVSDPVADKEYYLCTLLVSRENYNDYSILSRVKLDPTSDEKVKVEFDIDLSSLIESWLSSDNTKYGVGYVPSYAIMSYSEEEGFEYLSRPMTIDIDSRFNDLLEEYVVVNANGKSYVSYMTRYNYGLEFIFTNAA